MSNQESSVALIDDPAGIAVADFTRELVPTVGVTCERGRGGLMDEHLALRFARRSVDPDQWDEETRDREMARARETLERGGAVGTAFGSSDDVDRFRLRYSELRTIQRAGAAIIAAHAAAQS